MPLMASSITDTTTAADGAALFATVPIHPALLPTTRASSTCYATRRAYAADEPLQCCAPLMRRAVAGRADPPRPNGFGSTSQW